MLTLDQRELFNEVVAPGIPEGEEQRRGAAASFQQACRFEGIAVPGMADILAAMDDRRDTSKSDAILAAAGAKPMGEDHPAYVKPGSTKVTLGGRKPRRK